MSSGVELPAPKQLWRVESEILKSVADACGDDWLIFPVLHEGLTHRDLNNKQKEVLDAGRPLFEGMYRRLGHLPITLEVDCRDVAPGNPQREDAMIWHLDSGSGIELTVSDELPTVFAYGYLPSDHKIAMFITDGLMVGGGMVEDAVKAGELKVVTSDPNWVTEFTIANWHRGQINETEEPISRAYVRAVPATFTYDVVVPTYSTY